MISSDFDLTLATVYNNLRGVIELEFSILSKLRTLMREKALENMVSSIAKINLLTSSFD
jgi:hypothetical protein